MPEWHMRSGATLREQHLHLQCLRLETELEDAKAALAATQAPQHEWEFEAASLRAKVAEMRGRMHDMGVASATAAHADAEKLAAVTEELLQERARKEEAYADAAREMVRHGAATGGILFYAIMSEPAFDSASRTLVTELLALDKDLREWREHGAHVALSDVARRVALMRTSALPTLSRVRSQYQTAHREYRAMRKVLFERANLVAGGDADEALVDPVTNVDARSGARIAKLEFFSSGARTAVGGLVDGSVADDGTTTTATTLRTMGWGSVSPAGARRSAARKQPVFDPASRSLRRPRTSGGGGGGGTIRGGLPAEASGVALDSWRKARDPVPSQPFGHDGENAPLRDTFRFR